MPRGVGLYRLLLRLYPARFREEYGGVLEQEFVDECREAGGRRLWLGLRLLFDLARSLPVELARELRQDVRHSLRVYASRPLTSALALVSLALAIGATTGVFSVVDALLLRSLPFRDADRLVRLEMYSPVNATDRDGFHRWRRSTAYLEDAATYTSAEMTIGRVSEPDRARVTETSANFFSMLGAAAQAGRAFAPDEDAKGRGNVAVISDALWTRMFDRDPRALGTALYVNGVALSVIGIAPRRFDYPQRTAVWTPTAFDVERIPKRDMTFWVSVGRLAPGLAIGAADAALEAEARRLEPSLYDSRSAAARAGYSRKPRLVALRDELAGPVRSASMALLGAVVFVLLIACANVANLLLTRVVDRRHELAVRAALGASRARLAQQLMTEAVLLSLAGGLGGLGVGVWAARLASLALPPQSVAQDYAAFDWRVLAFAVLISCATGVAFGVLPAWMAGRLQSVTLTTRSGGGRRVGLLRFALVGGQVALTLMLVAGAAAMTRGFSSLMAVDLGYQTPDLVTAKVSFAGTRDDNGDRGGQYVSEALARLRALPGVSAAAAVSDLPLATSGFSGGFFTVEGGHPSVAVVVAATPGYFRAMSTPVVAGREFREADRAANGDVAIVNEAFARLVAGGASVVGKTLMSGRVGGEVRPRTIVGVTKTALYNVTTDRRAEMAQVFVPLEPGVRGNVTFVVREAGGGADGVRRCRSVLAGIDRDVPVFDVKTLEERVAEDVARPWFYTAVVSFFGVFALLLSVVGVYGVASYSVTRRTHEIGVRLALGASPGRVRRLLTREVSVALGAGLAAGGAGAAAVSRVVAHVMPGERIGLDVCALAALFVVLTTIVAVRAATRRVGRLEPLLVLRAE